MSTPSVKRPKTVPPLRIPKGSPKSVPKPGRLEWRPPPVAGSVKVQWLCARGYENEEAPWLVLLEPPNAEPESARVRILAAHHGEAEAGSATEPLARGTARGRWRVPLVEETNAAPARYVLEAEVRGRKARSCELPVYGRLAFRVLDADGEPLACSFELIWPGGRRERVRTDPHGIVTVREGFAGEVVVEHLAPLAPPPEAKGQPEALPETLERAEAEIEPNEPARLRTHHAYTLTWLGWELVELGFEPVRAAVDQEVELFARTAGKPPAPLRFELRPVAAEGASAPANEEPVATLEARVEKGEARAKWKVERPPAPPPEEEAPPAGGDKKAEGDDDLIVSDGSRALPVAVAHADLLACELDRPAWWFVARCEDREAKSISFPHGRLEIGAYLRVRLIDEITDEPLADLEVQWIAPDGEEGEGQTDGDGVLAIEDLVEPGFYTLVPKRHPERGRFAPVRVSTVDRKTESVDVRLSLEALAPEVEEEIDALCREVLEALNKAREAEQNG